jgi:hypothetical protein
MSGTHNQLCISIGTNKCIRWRGVLYIQMHLPDLSPSKEKDVSREHLRLKVWNDRLTCMSLDLYLSQMRLTGCACMCNDKMVKHRSLFALILHLQCPIQLGVFLQRPLTWACLCPSRRPVMFIYCCLCTVLSLWLWSGQLLSPWIVLNTFGHLSFFI